MRKSSAQGDTVLFNFGIPAFKSQDGTVTCPNAKNCVSGCYARSGAYRFSQVKTAYERRLSFVRSPLFCLETVRQIKTQWAKAKKKDKKILIRIHDSGDFFSEQYTRDWLRIIRSFRTTQDVTFYAYTKQVALFKLIQDDVPNNLMIIYSYGGHQDHLIDPERDRHAKVFENETDVPASYIDASHDDKLALTQNKKIALVYHGTKNYANTTWNKVS